MRDDIGKLNIPPAAKRYARLSGAAGTSPKKLGLYTRVVADLVNGGKTKGFRSKDVSVRETARTVVSRLING